jgi:hypothetical protein
MTTQKNNFIWELHAHTSPVSNCSEVSPEECVKAYAELNYDGIVITNHFTPDLLTRFKNAGECASWYMEDFKNAEEAGKKYGIKVVLGMEIRFTDNINDYLVHGIDESFVERAYDFLDKGLHTFYQAMHSNDILILQAHPFRDKMVRADLCDLDGIEAFNMHPGHNSRIGFASKYAKEHDLLITAGTDFHHPGHQGMGATVFCENPDSGADLVRLLRERKYSFLIGGRILKPYDEL